MHTTDELLEIEIEKNYKLMTDDNSTAIEQNQAHDTMMDLIKKRSPEQIKKMEMAKGLSK